MSVLLPTHSAIRGGGGGGGESTNSQIIVRGEGRKRRKKSCTEEVIAFLLFFLADRGSSSEGRREEVALLFPFFPFPLHLPWLDGGVAFLRHYGSFLALFRHAIEASLLRQRCTTLCVFPTILLKWAFSLFRQGSGDDGGGKNFF